MIKKIGKPVDILKFKSSMFDEDTLRSLVSEYKRLCRFITENPKANVIDKCPLCGARKKRLAQTIYGIGYNECNRCEMLYADKQLDTDELKKYYSKSKNYSKLTYSNKKVYKYRTRNISSPKIDFISRYIKTRKKRWLDVGSGIGDVVYNLKKKGFEALGLEVNEESIKFSKEIFGLNLENKTIFEIFKEEGPGSFDIVSYFGVLEHMPEPIKQISCAVRLLSPGGLLVLDVPNAKSFSVMADIFFPGSVVRQTVPAFHIMLFSENSLLALARKFRLKPEAMWLMGLDFYNLILHLGLHIPGFLESDICRKLLSLNNELQSVFDANEMSDDILFVCRK